MPCIPPSYLSLSPVGSHAPFFRRCSRKWDGREGGCERQTRRAQRQPPLRVRVRRSFLPRRMDGLTELETFEATATEGRRERLLLFAAVATVEGGAKSRPQRRRQGADGGNERDRFNRDDKSMAREPEEAHFDRPLPSSLRPLPSSIEPKQMFEKMGI